MMKKLFSIALVIAMAISCLAIFPSAAISFTDDSVMYYETEFINDNKQVVLTLTVDSALSAFEIDEGSFGMYLKFDATKLSPVGEGTFETNIELTEEPEWWFKAGQAEFDAYLKLINKDLPNKITAKATLTFNVLANAGEEIVITDDGSQIFFGGEGELNPDVAALTFTVPAAAPTYEAPASAKAQELAGCEACGVEAGVRFIAEVDAAADEYGMYITANGKTYTLTSADSDFIAKVETEETVTFTAVIFSDLTFEVVVFEKYGDTEVKSGAVRN